MKLLVQLIHLLRFVLKIFDHATEPLILLLRLI